MIYDLVLTRLATGWLGHELTCVFDLFTTRQLSLNLLWNLSRSKSRVYPLFCFLLNYHVHMILLASFDDLAGICWCYMFLDFFLSTNFLSWFHPYMSELNYQRLEIIFNFFIQCKVMDFLSSLKYINSAWLSLFHIIENSIRFTTKSRTTYLVYSQNK